MTRVSICNRVIWLKQADVTIRGIFENTGFRVGSSTLFDPQSGHYFAEIPIAPQMLTGPSVLTGADNALYGMNSSVGMAHLAGALSRVPVVFHLAQVRMALIYKAFMLPVAKSLIANLIGD